MEKRRVFYSFHFDNDVMRVQQIRNMGVIEGNEPISPNRWEEVQRAGEAAVKRWIDDNMYNRSCVVVLVGSQTAQRRWVKYEIEKGWTDGKGLLGIYVHNVKCPRNDVCVQGTNPFEQFNIAGKPFSNIAKCCNPQSWDAYNGIANNIDTWIEEAISIRSVYQ